jgi:transposase
MDMNNMAVRYKIFGKQEYAYRIWNEKNPKTGKWMQRSEYLGVVMDKENAVYEKRNETKRAGREAEQKEQSILDYGDCYFLIEFLKHDTILPVMQGVFEKHMDTLLCLLLYKLHGGSAMRHVEPWYDGNVAKILLPKAAVSTQRISEFLGIIGEEKLQFSFFKDYLASICGDKSGLIIDSTGLPNQVNMPITNWGHHDGGIEKETRLILAVEKETKMPLYFRYVTGNIGDVSTLITTICEIKKLGVVPTLCIIDAGYYSEPNIKALYGGNISFLTRLPSNRVIYKSLIHEDSASIERSENAVKYGKRGFFIRKHHIDLYGQPAFAYVVCDPVRRGKEISKKILELGSIEDNLDLEGSGMMILVSNIDMNIDEVVPLYYSRQMAEQLFGISKDDLNILPIRTHSEARFRGLMLLSFIALIIYAKMKAFLGTEITVEQVLLLMRYLKCKVYSDKSLIVSEVTKKQRLIFENAKFLVPKNSGI